MAKATRAAAWALILGVLTTATPVGGSAPGKVPGGEKLSGDRLPARALFRVGTLRLQHMGPLYAVTASADGRLLASCGSDRAVYVWDGRDGKPLWKFEVSDWGPWALAFSRDG